MSFNLCIFYHSYSALMESLITPLQDKIEDWKKTANQLDKDHAKGRIGLPNCVGCNTFALICAWNVWKTGPGGLQILQALVEFYVGKSLNQNGQNKQCQAWVDSSGLKG